MAASDSSAQRNVDLLTTAHHRDAPDPRRSAWAAFSRSLVFADLLAVDGEDDVALLEADILRRGAAADIGDDDALGVGIEMQLVRHRRGDGGDFAPWNGERVVMTSSLRPLSGATSSAIVSLTGLPPRCTSICAEPPSGRVAKR